MITIISPAKTLDLSTTEVNLATEPIFKKDIQELVGIMKTKNASDIKELMGVSENLAQLNEERYQNFKKKFTFDNSKQALLAFKGDVYQQLKVEEYGDQELKFAQDHVRILSGLYGLLRPLDLIQPYRLEMGTKLENDKGKDLYEFWGAKIAEELNKLGKETIINLASQEYFKAVDKKTLKANIISPTFKEYRDGKYKIIGIFAKKARGMMTNFIIQNQINESEKLKVFNDEGYEYDEKLSTEKEWVFVR
ncbi:peroxide stress protein YaaA [Litoribacter ruber]|uniref:peroxide stress protein YaaA n=1 Tax=Litoribacter ruber TaxID=702568 RepID=UPI001BDAEAA9|nr:peroxide stress protein YaaA [Litoribacter ruber]MBT0811469.1 peroxide stress protein YaaA [Litoribacter ruber]